VSLLAQALDSRQTHPPAHAAHAGLEEVHPHAEAAAEAAESVATHGGNDAFWEMHDRLFENQDALETDDLLEYATAAGADRAVVTEDLSTGVRTARVRADFKGGIRSGVNGTPTFFVNGHQFEGNWADAAAIAAALRQIAAWFSIAGRPAGRPSSSAPWACSRSRRAPATRPPG
jgi:predicted DsbA family dithiol-disulfide isomerase